MQYKTEFEKNNRISELIKKAQEMEISAKGSNKECFFIDGYALLKTRDIKEQELQQKIKIEKQLKEKGVNIVQTLEYQVEGMENRFGFKSGYVLQEKAGGQPLHKKEVMQKMDNNEIDRVGTEYINSLSSLQTERQEFYDKFVSDWIDITKAGLKVDPSKTNNFYYEKGKKINFIDLDVGNRFKGDIELDIICGEIAVVLADGEKYYSSYLKKNPQIRTTANMSLSPIFKKLTKAMVKQGLEKEQIKKILNGRFPEVELDEKDGHKQGLSQEDGLSQAEIERIKKDKEAEERTEQEMAKYEERKSETPKKGDKPMTMNDVKRALFKSQITKTETEQQMEEMQKKQRARALFKRNINGIKLTEEEQRLVEEAERQKVQIEVEYKKRQEKRRNMGQQH